MKFRNRFMKYGRGYSLNTSAFNEIRNPLMCFEGEEGGDDSGGGDSGGGSDENITLSKTELQAMISDGVKAAMTKDNNDDKSDAFDKIENERKSKEQEKTKIAETRKTVAFDMAFNGFINKNEKSFTINVDKFRESAKGLEGEELERVLSVTAAKDFFRKDENVKLLPERDREYIKSQIIGLADNAIDYRKAFTLIEDALHVKNRISENGQYRKNSSESNIDNTDTPNVTAYLERCAAAGKPKSAA